MNVTNKSNRWKSCAKGDEVTSNLFNEFLLSSGIIILKNFKIHKKYEVKFHWPWKSGTYNFVIDSQTISSPNFKGWLLHNTLKFASTQGLQGEALLVFIGILWAIWKTRNAQIFDASRATIEAFLALFLGWETTPSIYSK